MLYKLLLFLWQIDRGNQLKQTIKIIYTATFYETLPFVHSFFNSILTTYIV